MAFISDDARWYLADIIFEHKIQGDPRNVVHTNLHLIEAENPGEAFRKAMALGAESDRSYINTDGGEVRVIFRGLRDLMVIYDSLEDGAELTYSEEVGVPELELRASVLAKNELTVFSEAGRKCGVPNYMPESVMRMLEDTGLDRDDLQRKG